MSGAYAGRKGGKLHLGSGNLVRCRGKVTFGSWGLLTEVVGHLQKAERGSEETVWSRRGRGLGEKQVDPDDLQK